MNRELVSTPLPQWKTYLRWTLLNTAAPRLSKAFVDDDFEFYGKTLTGTPENEPRWKRCVSATSNAVGMSLGKAWVRDYFPPQAKARADEMVRNLVAALRDDLQTLPWMGEATRRAATEKLAAFNPKIGYPTPVAGLRGPHDRPRAVRPERAARGRVRVPPPALEGRQAPSTARTGR